MERDEYQIFAFPMHTFPQYAEAHALAGDLELVPEDKPKMQKPIEDTLTLARLARAVK